MAENVPNVPSLFMTMTQNRTHANKSESSETVLQSAGDSAEQMRLNFVKRPCVHTACNPFGARHCGETSMRAQLKGLACSLW